MSKKLWAPPATLSETSNLSRYAAWLKVQYGKSFGDYNLLWRWSIADPAAFWESIWKFFNVQSHAPYTQIMSADPMPYTRWFVGSTLNYAEHIFLNKTAARPAILFRSEQHALASVSWEELEEQTAALQAFLRQAGVGAGDRVAAWLPNIPHATAAMLATLSLGAIWSSCSPDFGVESVTDRFRQIAPKVLIAADGYTYQGKPYDRMPVLREIVAALPSVEQVILIPYQSGGPAADGISGKAVLWEEALRTPHGALKFTPVPFSHPIWILYSSGTMGVPKAITHSHGGMLLEHLKYLSLHNDVRPGEKFFWYSTTGWMMWNFVQASLLAGATIVLYDGSPVYPDPQALWRLAEEAGIHHFGTSAPFIIASMKAGSHPGENFRLDALRSVGSTGSPLPPEGFDYIYDRVKKEVWLCSMSGGTDICTAWVGGCPWRPVYEGEIQCRCLGAAIFAYDEQGLPVEEKVGEMVVTRPMPCMPVFFWNDADHRRYLASYFGMYPDVWRHGDWLEITEHDGVVISGRSDATLNRQGVRIGTAEIYRAVDKIAEVEDALVVNLELPGGGDYMPLFVKMKAGAPLTEEVKKRIRQMLRNEYSPRHIPDEIIPVQELPYTISGKKMETPVKRILCGQPPEKAVSTGAMRNPASLDFFARWAAKLAREKFVR